MLTVETEVNGDLQSTNEKGVLPWLVCQARRAGTRDFCSALAALVGPESLGHREDTLNRRQSPRQRLVVSEKESKIIIITAVCVYHQIEAGGWNAGMGIYCSCVTIKAVSETTNR